MIVILNNGTRISVPMEAVQDLVQKLMKGEATQWQCQIDTSNNKVTSIINLKEVAAICNPWDIQADSRELVAKLDLYKGSLPNKDESGKFWCDKFRQYLAEYDLINK